MVLAGVWRPQVLDWPVAGLAGTEAVALTAVARATPDPLGPNFNDVSSRSSPHLTSPHPPWSNLT